MNLAAGEATDSLVEVNGPNFSGRTEFVRNAVQTAGGFYLYPEIPDNLTGLAVTVHDELVMGLSTSSLEDEALEVLAIKDLLKRNPTELSGGEQASVVLAAALCSGRTLIGIDCALEQIDAQKKNAILKLLMSGQSAIPKVLVIDNRLREHDIHLSQIRMPANQLNDLLVNSSFASEMDWQTIEPAQALVELENVCFSWGQNDVLKGCTTVFKPGEVYFLKGANGAGKTTLSRVLTGLNRPSNGVLRVNGKPADMSRLPVFSYHYQNQDSQILSTTVWSELQIRTNEECESPNWISRLLSLFGLTSVKKEHPVDLPFVLRKRVALAATFASRRPWMILDEPTLGQDSQTCKEIAKIVSKFALNGFGFVIITHSDYFEQQLPMAHILMLQGGCLTNRRS